MRLVRLHHVAATGLESRAAGPRTADVGTDDAGVGTRTPLAALATTSPPLQQHGLGDHNAATPSAPFRLPGPGGVAACLMRSLPPRPIPHCKVTRARLRSQPAGRWPAPSLTKGETTPQTRERSASAPGPSRPESRSSNAGIPVKYAGIRKTASPLERRLTAPARKSVNQGCMSRLGLS